MTPDLSVNVSAPVSGSANGRGSALGYVSVSEREPRGSAEVGRRHASGSESGREHSVAERVVRYVRGCGHVRAHGYGCGCVRDRGHGRRDRGHDCGHAGRGEGWRVRLGRDCVRASANGHPIQC